MRLFKWWARCFYPLLLLEIQVAFKLTKIIAIFTFSAKKPCLVCELRYGRCCSAEFNGYSHPSASYQSIVFRMAACRDVFA